VLPDMQCSNGTAACEQSAETQRSLRLQMHASHQGTRS
jgi:hypothetical protein